MNYQNKFKKINTNVILVQTLFLFGFKDVSESLIKIFSDLIITSMRFGITVWLYYYLFLYKGGTILGVNLQTVAWAMFLYFVFMYINPRNISTEIQKDIQSGKIEIILTKPVNYTVYKLGEYLGNRFTTFVISSFIGICLIIFFLGIPNYMISLNFVITFPIVFVLSFIISFELFAILGFLAFWIQEINPVRWILDKMIMILGGAYLPIAFFPEFLKKFSLYSPMGASQFITYSAYANWSTIYIKMFLIQIFWIFILGYFLFHIQKKAFAKLSVNGG